jgi:hypothetical protein
LAEVRIIFINTSTWVVIKILAVVVPVKCAQLFFTGTPFFIFYITSSADRLLAHFL